MSISIKVSEVWILGTGLIIGDNDSTESSVMGVYLLDGDAKVALQKQHSVLEAQMEDLEDNTISWIDDIVQGDVNGDGKETVFFKVYYTDPEAPDRWYGLQTFPVQLGEG